ncbi:hypothetical protein ARMGADRAFT_1031142 [Armillaria gallica]|uniref:Uncharacterized protein n=1 Tax=Armillaria gallica TaxID=47427 RepID=A0A2H3DDQ5_ARMGA|nr:hypothetical protein ARMGADRAFT_1031142 [Armillaria gallica]
MSQSKKGSMTGLSQDDFNRNQPQGTAGCGHWEHKENIKALAGHQAELAKSSRLHEAHQRNVQKKAVSAATSTSLPPHITQPEESITPQANASVTSESHSPEAPAPLYPSQFTTGVPSLPSAPQPGAATTEPFTFEPVGATSQVEPSGSTEAFTGSDDELDNLLIQSNFRVTSQPINILPWKHKSQSQKASSTNEESMSKGDEKDSVEKPTQHYKKWSQTIKDIINEKRQNILKHAYLHYKRLLTHENTFLIDSHDRKEVTDITIDSWNAACKELVIEMVLDPMQQELNLVTFTASFFILV